MSENKPLSEKNVHELLERLHELSVRSDVVMDELRKRLE